MPLKYVLAWFGMMILAIINGTVREFVYKPYVGDLAAHQISTGTLLLFLAVYLWLLTSIWPIKSSKQAWTIGLVWVVMTLAFEFGFGHYVAGHPWSILFHDYNLLAGRIWMLIPVCTLIGPYFFFRFKQAT